ncbi:MAG TPA: antitoxin HicB [Candidatus Magasanikbacteria bacterium]|nr:antitoxin HicB [Candidatus Magasanikbacteria bacterium]
MKYPIILQIEKQGGFTVTVPDLPGCITYGKTIEIAKEKAKEAIEGYLETMETLKQSLPSRSDNSVFDIITIERKNKRQFVAC